MRLWDILGAYRTTKKVTSFQTKEKLVAYQQKKLKEHLRFLQKKSPYFQQHFAHTKSLEDFPFMNKETMMKEFNTLNTRSITKEHAFQLALEAENTRDFSPKINDVTIGLSSGTSGNRGLFLVSDKESNEWAGTILAKLLPNGLFQSEKIAFFLRANSNLYERVGSKHIQFVFFDLLDELAQHIDKLNTLQPTILAAPPSMMRMLAEKKKEGILTISPRKIITMAEVLDPLDEKFIESVFNQKVHQVYQCTEGFLGATCSHGTLHLNEDIVFIEKEFLEEEKTKFYPIITDFKRKTQPIVRYKLNDVLTLKKDPCPCGSPMTAIEQIEGRSDDIFSLIHQETGEEVLIFPDFIRRCVITSSTNIQEYRVIQHNEQHIEIMLKTIHEKPTEEHVKNALIDFLSSKNVILPKFEFTSYEKPAKGVKLKRVEAKKRDK